MELTEEQLSQMSPEQIAQLQKENCIFCHIVQGRAAAKKIYEDNEFIGILDINPANPGHVLLLPKEHYMIMPQLPDEITGRMFVLARKISHAILRAFKSEGTNFYVANGAVAGQKAQHFMMHIIPRMNSDEITCFQIPKKEVPEEELEKLRIILKKRLDQMIGKKQELLDLDKEPIKAEDIEKVKEKEANLDSITSFFQKEK